MRPTKSYKPGDEFDLGLPVSLKKEDIKAYVDGEFYKKEMIVFDLKWTLAVRIREQVIIVHLYNPKKLSVIYISSSIIPLHCTMYRYIRASASVICRLFDCSFPFLW